MKQILILKTVAFALLVAVSKSVAGWIPAGSTASPLLVKYAVYDLRNAGNSNIQFRLSNDVDYFFYFSPSDPLQMTKAGVIMSVLLTAKTSGEGVYVHTLDNSGNTVNAVQIGPN